MKTRTVVLAAALSLIVAAAAGAAAAPTSADHAAGFLNQPAMSVQPSCAATPATGATAAKAPGLIPAFSPRDGDLSTCGSCSANGCAGAFYNNFCFMPGGGYGNCLSPTDSTCSDGVTWQCQCWSGPLP